MSLIERFVRRCARGRSCADSLQNSRESRSHYQFEIASSQCPLIKNLCRQNEVWSSLHAV